MTPNAGIYPYFIYLECCMVVLAIFLLTDHHKIMMKLSRNRTSNSFMALSRTESCSGKHSLAEEWTTFAPEKEKRGTKTHYSRLFRLFRARLFGNRTCIAVIWTFESENTESCSGAHRRMDNLCRCRKHTRENNFEEPLEEV